MAYSLEIKINELPKTGNTWSRTHFYLKSKASKHWKTLIHYHTLGKRPSKSLKRVKLILTRHSSSEIDYDGLVTSFKMPIDGLVECGIMEDDKISNTGQWDCRWEKCKRGEGFIVIRVESDE